MKVIDLYYVPFWAFFVQHFFLAVCTILSDSFSPDGHVCCLLLLRPHQ